MALVFWLGLGHNRRVVLRVPAAVLAGLCLAACVPLIDPIASSTDGDEDSDSDASSEGEASETDDEPPTHPCGPVKVFVSQVIDGDTIELSTGERVRYILVDTPETGGNSGVQCWGPQATEYNRSLVENKAVTLHYDDECRDQYDRLLAYVTVDAEDDLDVNAALMENGYACVSYFPPNGDERLAEFQALEDAAKQSELGMWGACGTVACDN